MTVSLIPNTVFRAFDASGVPLAGGLLYTYGAGGTTPLTTYTDSTGLVLNANPVVLDSVGQASVWLGNNAYKFILKDSGGVTQPDYPVDNISRNASYADLITTNSSLTAFEANLQNGLNNTLGGKLVGHNYAEAPTYIKTVSDILNGDKVSLFRFLPQSGTQNSINNIKNSTQTGSGNVDITNALQTWSSALPASKGGGIFNPVGYNYIISATITNSQLQNWVPYTIENEAGTIITTTVASGAVFLDTSQNLRLTEGLFIGPGRATSTQLFSGQLTQGKIDHVRISGYGSGIYINQCAAGFISNCNFGNCGSGIDIEDTSPNFSNTILIQRNWFESCQNAIYLKNCYGITIDTCTMQNNSYGLNCLTAREVVLQGANWFESNSLYPMYYSGNCSGVIPIHTHMINNGNSNSPFIDYANCAIDNYLIPAKTILQNTSTVNIPNNTPTSITWNNIISDPLSCFVSGQTNINTKVRGDYNIFGNLYFQAIVAPAANSIVVATLYDSSTIFCTVTAIIPTNANFGIPPLVIPTRLLNTSSVGIQVTQNSGSAMTLLGGSNTQLAVINKSAIF